MKSFVIKQLYYLIYFLILLIGYSFTTYSQSIANSPIPSGSRQLLLMLTDSVLSTNGFLVCFERKTSKDEWIRISERIPAVIGKGGLGWGRGLNPTDSSKLAFKVEGDGRSPAGIFTLGPAFGYAKADEMIGLKIPYIHITEMLECIDDVNSSHYNQLILRNEAGKVDWQSSEKMYYSGIWYEQGVIINHNSDPVIKGGGSCIFLHNWSQPNETTSGCTEIEPAQLRKIIYWLDSEANPVFVQLTKKVYYEYKEVWRLP